MQRDPINSHDIPTGRSQLLLRRNDMLIITRASFRHTRSFVIRCFNRVAGSAHEEVFSPEDKQWRDLSFKLLSLFSALLSMMSTIHSCGFVELESIRPCVSRQALQFEEFALISFEVQNLHLQRLFSRSAAGAGPAEHSALECKRHQRSRTLSSSDREQLFIACSFERRTQARSRYSCK